MTRAEFLASAKAHSVTIDGVQYIALPKAFSTGSVGWNLNTKAELTVDGRKVRCQVGLNITVIGSKNEPQ